MSSIQNREHGTGLKLNLTLRINCASCLRKGSSQKTYLDKKTKNQTNGTITLRGQAAVNTVSETCLYTRRNLVNYHLILLTS